MSIPRMLFRSLTHGCSTHGPKAAIETGDSDESEFGNGCVHRLWDTPRLAWNGVYGCAVWGMGRVVCAGLLCIKTELEQEPPPPPPLIRYIRYWSSVVHMAQGQSRRDTLVGLKRCSELFASATTRTETSCTVLVAVGLSLGPGTYRLLL